MTYDFEDRSTYLPPPPYFEGMPKEPRPVHDVIGARELAIFGDSITTDHISPAGSIQPREPGRRIPDQLSGAAESTSTPTARAAATTT